MMDSLVTIDRHFLPESVLVVFRVLEHGTHALFLKFLCQPLSDDPLALVQFLDDHDSFFAQQSNKGVKE